MGGEMSKTILVVDDSCSIREVIDTALTREGYDVVCVDNGQEGLAKLDGRQIHLIISDISMPGMDGEEMVREVKKLSDYESTPICMLTTKADKERASKAQVTSLVVKPFRPPALVDTVSKLLAA